MADDLKKAFTPEHLELIATQTLPKSQSGPQASTSPGNDTVDTCEFLVNIGDLEHALKVDEVHKAVLLNKQYRFQSQRQPQQPTILAASSSYAARAFNALGIETPPGDRPGAWSARLERSVCNLPAEQAGRIEQDRALTKLDAKERRACLAGAEKHLDVTRAYCKRHNCWDPFQSEQEFDRLMKLPPDHEEWTKFDRRQRKHIDEKEGERATSAAETFAGPAHPVTNTDEDSPAATGVRFELDKEQCERAGAARRNTAGSSPTGIRADDAVECFL